MKHRLRVATGDERRCPGWMRRSLTAEIIAQRPIAPGMRMVPSCLLRL